MMFTEYEMVQHEREAATAELRQMLDYMRYHAGKRREANRMNCPALATLEGLQSRSFKIKALLFVRRDMAALDIEAVGVEMYNANANEIKIDAADERMVERAKGSAA